jgi:hypothetical protein
MVVFGIQCDKESNKFMEFHQGILAKEAYLKLFDIKLKQEPNHLWLVSYRVLPPDPWYFGGILILIGALFSYFPTWYVTSIVVFFALQVFWTQYFYRFMIFAGMNKQKIGGTVELLTAQQAVMRLYRWDK